MENCFFKYFSIILSNIISFLSLSTVAHASLFIQNISVTVCSIVLMLVFSYKKWIEEIWDGWLTVSPSYIGTPKCVIIICPFRSNHVFSIALYALCFWVAIAEHKHSCCYDIA